MSDIATRQLDLSREYLQQKLWKNFDTWLVVRIKELEAELLKARKLSDHWLASQYHKVKHDELKARLKAVEEVITDLDTQTTNSHAVRLLRAAIREQSDDA